MVKKMKKVTDKKQKEFLDLSLKVLYENEDRILLSLIGEKYTKENARKLRYGGRIDSNGIIVKVVTRTEHEEKMKKCKFRGKSMILTDGAILDKVDEGKPLVEPFNIEQLTPNGYDLSIEEIQVGEKVFKFSNHDINIMIRPLTHFKVMSKETVLLPDDMCASLWLRTTYARKGVMATFGKVDAGYNGKIAMSLFNGSDKGLVFEREMKKNTICQIVFEQLDKVPLKSYKSRSGNYQNQKTLVKK